MGTKPVIGITMGDAAGIGPEVIVKSLEDLALLEQIKPVVIGDANALRSVIETLGLTFSRDRI
jgi:4-hydroxythreonine-4-phosphate dehydrogenase